MADLPLPLIPDFDLGASNTLALRARSRFGIRVSDPAMLPALFAQKLPVRILGGGSNVVLAPEFEGVTALMAFRGIAVIEDGDDGVLVEAAAGESWNDVVGFAVAQGFGGIENLASIPGTIGAAPVQNIGAYGAELANTFFSLTAYDRVTGAERVFDRKACAFAYRDSVFKHEPERFVVISVRLLLPKPWRPNLTFAGLTDLVDVPDLSPRLVMDRVAAIRASKLPDWRSEPNAGSFFQNPIVTPEEAAPVISEFSGAPNFAQTDGRTKLSAGWLIEKSGLKGFRMERAGISDRHALVVVNLGGADQTDIARLAARVKATVKARFGIQLHEEPVFI